MQNEKSRFLLFMLLSLYLLGGILRLLAGRVPSLLIVTLHVIPPALFAVIHGARIYGSRGILVFTALCLSVGAFFEIVSLGTGFPFGHYRFTELMGPKLFDLPILLALAYIGMGYSSWVLGRIILVPRNETLSRRNFVLLPVVASFVMTAWDLSTEPVWADIDHAWVWRDGGSYYGVPISNFFGWFLTTYVFYQLFALYLRNRAVVSSRIWRLAILLYAISAIENLFVVAPGSLGEVFVDASGTRWRISNILWTSRLVSLFLMIPVSLFAWIRAFQPTEPVTAQISQSAPSE